MIRGLFEVSSEATNSRRPAKPTMQLRFVHARRLSQLTLFSMHISSATANRTARINCTNLEQEGKTQGLAPPPPPKSSAVWSVACQLGAASLVEPSWQSV